MSRTALRRRDEEPQQRELPTLPSAKLVVRCVARRRGDVWVALCVDFTLAAQGDSLEEAREKLHAQIADYVTEAVTVDAEHAAELLKRKGPLLHRLQYRLAAFTTAFRRLHDRYAYTEPLPLQPVAT